MRLDAATLTQAEIERLTDALLAIPTLKDHALRATVLQTVQDAPEIKGRVPESGVARTDVWALWRVCSQYGFLDGLIDAIRAWDGDTEYFRALVYLRKNYDAAATARDPFLDTLKDLVEQVQTADPGMTITNPYQRRFVLPVGADPALLNQSFSDVLRSLLDFPADAQGAGFPLYSFLNGLFAYLFTRPEQKNRLTMARALLDDIAQNLGVTEDGIKRLSAKTEGETGGTVESAILVVIAVDNPAASAPPYTLTILEWLPYTSADLRAAAGEGHCIYVLRPQRCDTLDTLRQKVAEALARPLSEKFRPLIEFFVPASLLCEPFESELVEADSAGGLFKPKPQPLFKRARVVIRSWERSQTKHEEIAEALRQPWDLRWKIFARLSDSRIPTVWADTDVDTVLANLTHDDAVKGACCLGAKYTPTWPDTGEKLAQTLLLGGLPIAVWLRNPAPNDPQTIQTTLEQILARGASDPADLRDRVNSLRVKPEYEKGIALFWDDPRRFPLPPQEIENPLT